jgi:hypothetical protein
MTAGIVKTLEPIDIHEDHRDGHFLADSIDPETMELIFEATPVPDMGQVIQGGITEGIFQREGLPIEGVKENADAQGSQEGEPDEAFILPEEWSAPVFRTRCYERLGCVVGV